MRRRRLKNVILAGVIALVVGGLLVSILLPTVQSYGDRRRRAEERQKHVDEAVRRIVGEQFGALPPADAAALEAKLRVCRDESQMEPIVAAVRPAYLRDVIARKIAGEAIPAKPYEAILAMLGEHPNDVPAESLRNLLRASRDDTTIFACIGAMGASGNGAFADDVRGHSLRPGAMSVYARLKGKGALPHLLYYIDLDRTPGTGYDPTPEPFIYPVQGEAIAGLGELKDPSLVPLLNDIGERDARLRHAVEMALAQIDDAAAVTVAANLFSLPSSQAGFPNEGRWNSNGHSAARNKLLTEARQYGVPEPQDHSPEAWSAWWAAHHGRFPSIESVRARFDREHYRALRSPNSPYERRRPGPASRPATSS